MKFASLSCPLIRNATGVEAFEKGPLCVFAEAKFDSDPKLQIN